MSKVTVFSSLSALILSGALASAAVGQTASTDGTAQPSQTSPAAQSGQTAQSGSMSPSDSSTYATGKPLEDQSKEGFWGHMNPFARKKWVKRQVDPIKDRTNELDQLQAKNANDIRDVDSRSQAGINRAMNAANTADQHALDASNRANAANGIATDASNRTTSLNGTVSNLDQYQTVAETAVPFVPGRTVLGPKGKAELDDVASKLSGEKGYIIEVEGYSRSGVQTSQAMADAVVRYLVTEHQVPIYRIYRTGMGKNEAKSTDGEKIIVNGVRVSLMHNSLATMGTTTASNTGATSPAPMPPQ
jgi:outer membrane protein OmpA-like peptidoglycan-associated protein